MRINLKNLAMDKNYGVEIFNGPKNCTFLLNLPEVKQARGFLQCDFPDYSFIEFWTDNEDFILQAFYAIENYLK